MVVLSTSDLKNRYDNLLSSPRSLNQESYAFCVSALNIPLPSNVNIHTYKWEAFMKYAVQIGSGAMIYMQSLIKIGSGIQKI
jgi:hypothetical protein